MSLLEKAIEKRMLSEAGKKVRFCINPTSLDANLIKETGRFLGSSSPGSVIKEAFLLVSCFFAEPNKRILDVARYDNAQRLFKLVEERNLMSPSKSKKCLTVSILRWNLLLLGKPLSDLGMNEPRSTEEIVNIVLRLCHQRLLDLFSSMPKGKAHGVA